MLSHRQDYSPPMPGEDDSNEQELQMEIDRLCSGPNAQRVPRPPASSKGGESPVLSPSDAF